MHSYGLRTSSLEIGKDAVPVHSSSQTRVKEDDQSKQEQRRKKQWMFRKIETCSERRGSDVVAECPRPLKSLWWYGPTQGQSHWKLLVFLLFSTPKVMQLSRISHWTEQCFLFSFFAWFWFLKRGKIICSCFSSLVTGHIWLKTWAFSPAMYC